jgi:hypothetical protein
VGAQVKTYPLIKIAGKLPEKIFRYPSKQQFYQTFDDTVVEFQLNSKTDDYHYKLDGNRLIYYQTEMTGIQISLLKKVMIDWFCDPEMEEWSRYREFTIQKNNQ